MKVKKGIGALLDAGCPALRWKLLPCILRPFDLRLGVPGHGGSTATTNTTAEST